MRNPQSGGAMSCARCEDCPQRARLEAERDALKAALMGGDDERAALAQALALQPRTASVLAILMRREQATRSSLYEALYGGEIEPRSNNAVTAQMTKLRLGLKRAGIALPGTHQNRLYGAVYALPPAEKAKVRARVAAWRAAQAEDAP